LLLPLPKDLKTALEESKDRESWKKANRSLLHDRFYYEWNPDFHDQDKGKFHRDFASRYSMPGDEKKNYAAFIARRSSALESAGYERVVAKQKSRLVLGLGLAHPTELGFMLDRNTGAPYIPGSSIKGFLRAQAERDERWKPDVVARVFGNKPDAKEKDLKRGRLSLADAFPEKWPRLEADVLTPHYAEWYKDKEMPGDWMNPVPNTFLTVAEGSEAGRDRIRQHKWLFFYRIDGETELPCTIPELLNDAFDEAGLGAKKCAGYGWFEVVAASSVSDADARDDGKDKPDITRMDEPAIRKLFHNACQHDQAYASELAKEISEKREGVVKKWKAEHDRKSAENKKRSRSIYAKLMRHKKDE